MTRITASTLVMLSLLGNARAFIAGGGGGAGLVASSLMKHYGGATSMLLRSSSFSHHYASSAASRRSSSSSSKLCMSDNEFDSYTAKTTFMFPGQGAQFVGMASTICDEVPKAKEMFDKAEAILGYDLLGRCKNGPKDVLDSTEVSQPAIFVCSMAAVEKLRKEQGDAIIDDATCAMGLSLGEYSALCFAGAISFEDGVKVTKARGEAMQAASDATEGGMVSVIGLPSDKVAEACAEAAKQSGKPLQVANFLCNGNYAVSGATAACDVLEKIAKPDFKARMTVRLAVAGAFHTDFMGTAVEKLSKVLDEITINKPRIPVISNVDAKPHSDPAVIKEILKKQVTNPVLWENSVAAALKNGYENGYECGPGKVIAGIMKRIDKAAKVTNIEV